MSDSAVGDRHEGEGKKKKKGLELAMLLAAQT
jgi:hypothetical protein